ncbi:MAG: molybdopterin biosynthesis protein [Sulfolobales archaeon]
MSRDKSVIFHKLVSLDEASDALYKILRESGYPIVEERDLFSSLGLVVAEDIYSENDYPPFDRSIADGYAVRSIDIAGANEIEPKTLRIIGRVGIGEIYHGEITEGTAVEIATGAMIPRGADSVIMIEYTKRDKDKLYVYRSTVPSENISQTGSDVSIGDLIVRRGTRLSFREIAVLASVGIGRVKVFKPLRVSVFSTGVELVSPGEKLDVGKIYDINGYSITSLFRELGFEAQYEGILRDDPQEISRRIIGSLERSDLIVTSGGTSAGFNDLVYRVIRDIGGEIVFHGVRVRPGRPTLLAKYRNKIIIGLPGFPLSAIMIFIRVIKPALLRLYGLEEERDLVSAVIPYKIEAGRGVRELIPVVLVEASNGFTAYPLQRGSGSVMSLMIADGFVEVSEDREYLDENEKVQVRLFGRVSEVPELYFIGSHCLGVELLLRLSGLRKYKSIYVGSLDGWRSVKRGEADLAGTHLLDEESGEYNIHMIKKMQLEREVYLIRGYSRRIGFIVKKGNPKNIRDFKDLLRDDVVFVNRNKGSGIRSFVDIMLRKILGEEDPAKLIKGYTYEVKTHTAVAAAVSQGRADVGVSDETVASFYNLDFIPLTEEIYDFVIHKNRINKKSVQRVIEVLRGESFKEALFKELRGYKPLPNTGEFIYKPF